jgi:AcrR family transcriptional regulator
MELREQLMLAALEAFNQKNFKFTMDDLARELCISKKTIYQEFSGKEDLMNETVEYFFRKVKDAERAIILDDSLDIVTKLKRVLIVMPDNRMNIDFRQISEVKQKYPKVYRQVVRHLDMEWEPTLNLYRMAVQEGKLRAVSETVFKLMAEGAMTAFLSSRELTEQGISYEAALEQMEDILFQGLELR